MHKSELKGWARQRFRGYENLLAPSFTPDLRRLDEEGIRLDVRQSIRHGFFSTQCALDSGLSRDEQRRMLAAAAEEAGGRILISFALSGESLEENLALLAHAERVGATHVTVGFPHGFTPASEFEIFEYVERIAARTGLAICLVAADRFGFHRFHPSGVPFDAIDRLADLDSVVALQMTGFDAGMILECCERFSDRLLVTTPHLAFLPMLCDGFGVQWSGSWSVEALQSPGEPHAVRFFELLREGRAVEAMPIYWRLAPALGAQARVSAAFAHTGTQHWPLVKYQQWLSGGNGGLTRQPVMRLFQRDMQAVRAGLAAVGVECGDPDDAFFVGRSARGARA